MTLYHYTTAQGLQGIVADRCLWTTDYRFLNDPSEFQYGWNIVQGALESRQTDFMNASTVAWTMIDYFNQNSDQIHAFVGSLTYRGDLLSQWRGYNRGKGYSVGFDDVWLRENATAQGFQVLPVIYEEDRQRDDANRAVEWFLNELPTRTADEEDTFREVKEAWTHLLRVALSFKNHHFHEECESRLVWVGTSWPPGIKTRIAANGLVPYRACQMDKVKPRKGTTLHPNNYGIEEIIIGPALPKQQESAVDALLASKSMRLTVRHSAIPYVAD
jgi:hypothetical protein